MDPRTKRLRALMSEHRLSPQVVGRLAGVEPRTVSNWKCLGSRDIVPQHRLDLLETRLALLHLGGNQ